MHSDTESMHLVEIEGAINSINAPCREMTVAVGASIRHFDIAAECSVWLHGERVKLRILQPADPVQISYALHDGECLAMQIRVLD
jgi:hypothetical protein